MDTRQDVLDASNVSSQEDVDAEGVKAEYHHVHRVFLLVILTLNSCLDRVCEQRKQEQIGHLGYDDARDTTAKTVIEQLQAIAETGQAGQTQGICLLVFLFVLFCVHSYDGSDAHDDAASEGQLTASVC